MQHVAADPSPRAGGARIQSRNTDLLLNVMAAAQQHRARRVVFASSNFVVAGHRFGRGALTTTMEPAPINSYGVSKLFGERVGKMFAERYGRTARPTRSTSGRACSFTMGRILRPPDIKATFDRIAKPPAGVSIPRNPLFAAVSEIKARDKYTVEFQLATPRSINFMMSAFASGWNVIFSKKTLEENDYNLRKVSNIPGTGPYKTQRRVENETG